MKTRQRLLVLGLVALFIAGACNLTAAPVGTGSGDATLAALAVQASVDASVRLTADAGGSGPSGSGSPDGDNAGPTNTLAPTATPPPQATDTPSAPTVSVSVDTNCRKGPDAKQDYLGALLVGESTEVLGRLSSNQWVVVKNPDGGPDCWLWLQYATVTGDLSALPVMTPPPTPTPVPWFNGTWDIMNDDEQFVLTVVQVGENFTATMTVPFAGLVTFTGTVSGPDLDMVSGTWVAEIGGTTGSFQWRLGPTTDQFQGSSNNDVFPNNHYQMCGARSGSGASLPAPCKWP